MKYAKLTVLFLFVAAQGMAQTERPTHELHAMMVFNFIKYIQWPNEGEGGEFVVGVMGEDDVFTTLKSWYDGKPKGTKKYVIKKLTSATEAADCNVVYLGKSKSREFEAIKGATT